MISWIWLGVRMGARAGLASGIGIGIPVVVVGILLTTTVPELALFISRAFLLLGLVLPLVYYFSSFLYAEILSQPAQARRMLFALSGLAWLPAFIFALVGYMMPVTIMPITLGAGVTFETSGAWYAEVFNPLLQVPAPVVAMVSFFGFLLAAAVLRATGAFERQPEEE